MRTNKKTVENLLKEKKFDVLCKQAKKSKTIVRYIFSCIYSLDDLIHWRAVEALALIANYCSEDKEDQGLNIVKRLHWSLMEESGATAWPATEALGAIIAVNPDKYGSFTKILMSFIEDPVFQRGVLWSARKIAEKQPELVNMFLPQIIELLESQDPTIRGYAVWVLEKLYKPNKEVDAILAGKVEKLANDQNTIFIYDNSELIKTTVDKIAKPLAILLGKQIITQPSKQDI